MWEKHTTSEYACKAFKMVMMIAKLKYRNYSVYVFAVEMYIERENTLKLFLLNL